MNDKIITHAKKFYEEVLVRNYRASRPCRVINELGFMFREALEKFENRVVTLDTYGDYDEENDIQYIVTFTIPVEWAKKKLKDYLIDQKITFKEFVNTYIFDEVEDLYKLALDEGVILESEMNKDSLYL